ncbi:MAG: glycosyltransferase family 2 protein [Terrimicrobiaceae bacterium]
MKIVIGLLAWNEENSIVATLASLGTQSLLQHADGRDFLIEILVVPNGCTDSTSAVAAEALRRLKTNLPALSCRVEPLAEGGKSNAWNHLVHELSPPDVDYFILMDADIELLTPGTLDALWRTLEVTPHALISTDLPVKHLTRKTRLSPLDRILLGAGKMTRAAPGQLTGQLYCARGSALRQVWMPKGLIVDDGYLKQILCTGGFSHAVDNSLIVRAEGASHLFECYTKLKDIWNHQIRQAIGHTLYTYLTKFVRTEIPERPVFSVLLELSRSDPEWFLRVIRNEVKIRGWWVMDTPSLLMRWRRVGFARGLGKLKFLILAAAATPFDLAVFLVSNSRLKSAKVKGIWKDTRTTTLSPASK